MNPLNHVAIIMDGNGRWGLKYRNSRNVGHKEGLKTVEIIIKSSNLEKKSKLRNLFEKEKNVICTPVYEDDSRSLNSVINIFLREQNFNLSQEIKNILIGSRRLS